MDFFCFINNWFTSYHVPSLSFGVASTILWIKSATAKVELGKKVAEITYPDPKDNVNLHDFFATAKIQSKYNSLAALSAAATALSQVIGW